MPVENGLTLSVETPQYGTFDPTTNFETPKDYSLPSAIKLEPTTPWSRTLTRRGSDPAFLTAKPTLKRFFTHSRSHTEAYGDGHHPLGSPTWSSSSSAADVGITRPHLNRIISALDFDCGQSDGEEGVPEITPPSSDSKEKVVLVHKILSKDSLPGVALKYGISMADLRRANHLWSSDSIHLRKVLYIPLEKAALYRKTITRSLSVDSPLSSRIDQSFEMHDMSNGKPSSPVLQRIPASQLSFFPPSSKSKGSMLFSGDIVDVSPRPHIPSRYTTNPPRTLTNILTSLPIAASTRDTIIARLSFDSSSNTSASDDQELELDEVQPSTIHFSSSKPRSRPPNPWMDTEQHSRKRKDRLGLPMSLPHPFMTTRVPSGGISMSPMGNTPLEMPVNQRVPWVHPDELSIRPTSIRTVQMEPSPGMQLPRVPIRSKSRPQEVISPASEPEIW